MATEIKGLGFPNSVYANEAMKKGDEFRIINVELTTLNINGEPPAEIPISNWYIDKYEGADEQSKPVGVLGADVEEGEEVSIIYLI